MSRENKKGWIGFALILSALALTFVSLGPKARHDGLWPFCWAIAALDLWAITQIPFRDRPGSDLSRD